MSDVVECLVGDKNSYLEQLTAVWWAASQEYVCLVVLLENVYTKSELKAFVSCFEGECKDEMGFGANKSVINILKASVS